MPIASVNPATGEVVKTFQPLSESEVEKKVQQAVATFKAAFAGKGKGRIQLGVTIEEDGLTAVEFRGTFVALK